MEHVLPGLTLTATDFKNHVNLMFSRMAASNSFGHNPPYNSQIMDKAIEAITYQFSIGAGQIERKIEKLKKEAPK